MEEQNNNGPKENTVIGILAIVFAFLCTIVGLVLAIIAMVNYPKESETHKYGKIALWICIVLAIISVVVGIIAAVFMGLHVASFYGG